jgi:uncharacterized membrane protein
MAEEKKVQAGEAKEKTTESVPAKKTEDESTLKTYKILCWVFNPITSLIWMGHEDGDLKWHAKTTLYFGLLSIGIYVVFGVVTMIPFLGLVSCCVLPVWGIVDLVVRILGAIKASKGERFEIPVIKDWVK